VASENVPVETPDPLPGRQRFLDCGRRAASARNDPAIPRLRRCAAPRGM